MITRAVRLAEAGGAIALVVTLGLAGRLIAVGGELALITLVPAAIGSLVPLRWPDWPRLLVLSAGLLVLSAIPALFGGLGLLYLPSLIMLLAAAS